MARIHRNSKINSLDKILYRDYLDIRQEATRLGVTQTELKDAFNHVGYLRSDVKSYLQLADRYHPAPHS